MQTAGSFHNLRSAQDLPGLEDLVHDASKLSTDDLLATLLTLLSASQVMVAVFDETDRLRASNEMFRKRLLVAQDEAPTWSELMRRNHKQKCGVVISTDDDVDGWISSVRSRRGALGHRDSETNFHDGRWALMQEVVLPNRWQLMLGSDVTDLNSSERSLRADRDAALKESRTDDLTQISNRGHILTRLSRVIETGGADLQPVGCACLCDIDHFKSINDTFGHQAGDRVLVQVARTFSNNIRFGDAFGRVGGEEFLLIMPRTGVETCREIVQRLMDTIGTLHSLEEAPDKTITLSFGFTEIEPNDTVDNVYARCDAALYAAKSGGRDQMAEA